MILSLSMSNVVLEYLIYLKTSATYVRNKAVQSKSYSGIKVFQ